MSAREKTRMKMQGQTVERMDASDPAWVEQFNIVKRRSLDACTNRDIGKAKRCGIYSAAGASEDSESSSANANLIARANLVGTR